MTGWDEVVAALAERPELHEAWLEGLAYNAEATTAVLCRVVSVEERRLRRFFLSVRKVSDETAMTLARHPDPKVRMALAENWGISMDALAVLARDPDWRVRDAVFFSPGREAVRRQLLRMLGEPEPEPEPEPDPDLSSAAPPEVLSCDEAQVLIESPEAYIRAKAAWDERVPQDLALQLADDPDDKVRLQLSMRMDLSEEQRAAIPYVVPYGYHEVPDWLKDLRTDPDALAEYADSGHVLIRRSVAKARHLPAAAVARLADDEDFFVRLTLAQCCDEAPHELIVEMFAWWHGVRWHDLHRQPNFVREGMAADFVTAANPRLRWAALADPTASPEIVEALSRDPDDRVRPGALGDRRLPLHRLWEALGEVSSARHAAGNPNLPEHVMHTLLDYAGVERLTTATAAKPSAGTEPRDT